MDESAENSAARKLAEAARQQLAAITGSMYDAVVNRTLDGIITSWNNGAERIYGYPAEEVIGRHGRFLIEPGKTGEFAALLAKIRGGEPVEEFETARIRKDGRRIAVSLTLSPIKDGNGEITGACAISRDITDRKMAIQLKNEVIAMTNHELRTPLTAISILVDLLARGDLGPMSEQAMEMIRVGQRNVRRMTRMIDDFLDIEKIESGGVKFKSEPVNVTDLINDAMRSLQPFANRCGVGLVLKDDAPNAHAQGDHDRLMQVLTNLLSNAIKFSPSQGTVEIMTVRLARMLRVLVSDHGPGIPEEYRGLIFQRFGRAPELNPGKFREGNGLGLSISKAIMEKLGGSIGFETQLGKGTSFYFEIPSL